MQTQLQLRAALRTGILRNKKDARLCTLRGKPVTMPSRKLDAGNVLGSDAPHVEHDGAEATSLQKQIGAAYALLNGVVLSGPLRSTHYLRNWRQARLRAFLLRARPMLRLCATGLKQISHGI